MSFATKWKYQASESVNQVANTIANIANIATIQSRSNSGDCGDYGDRVSALEKDLGVGQLGLPWPEPFPLMVQSVPWKYACLFALASHFGATLTINLGGSLTMVCPATMPQEAAQAAQVGLAELAGYVRERLQ